MMKFVYINWWNNCPLVLYCQKCFPGINNAQKPQNFTGAAPPDPCRSSLGGTPYRLARTIYNFNLMNDVLVLN